MATDIKRAMQLIAGREITPEDVARIQAIAHSLEIPLNDSMMPILISLDTYYGAFKDLPERNKRAANEAAQAAEKLIAGKVEVITSQAIAQVAPAIAKTVSDLAQQVASDVSAKDKTKWIAGSAAVAVVVVGLFGWMMHSTAYKAGFNSGYGVAYAEAKDEKAAAAWANTPEGQAALALSKNGSLKVLIDCSQPGWKVEFQSSRRVCIPAAAPKGVYGWKLP